MMQDRQTSKTSLGQKRVRISDSSEQRPIFPRDPPSFVKKSGRKLSRTKLAPLIADRESSLYGYHGFTSTTSLSFTQQPRSFQSLWLSDDSDSEDDVGIEERNQWRSSCSRSDSSFDCLRLDTASATTTRFPYQSGNNTLSTPNLHLSTLLSPIPSFSIDFDARNYQCIGLEDGGDDEGIIDLFPFPPYTQQLEIQTHTTKYIRFNEPKQHPYSVESHPPDEFKHSIWTSNPQPPISDFRLLWRAKKTRGDRLNKILQRLSNIKPPFLSKMDPPSPCTTPVPSVPAPPVPPRSTARSQPMYASGSMPGQQSMHLLSVEMPLALEPSHMEDTPSLSSGSSSDSGSPERFKKEPLPQAQKFSRESFFKGHKSKKSADATGKDPLRIRDGVEAKPSHAGVYTPETFPGPTPSPVIQTTPTINSYSFWATSPTSYFGGSSPNSAGPSRNTSYSSTASSTLRTPDASGFSFVKGKTLEHLRRFSNQIAAYGSGNHSTTSLAPTSARDSYFTDSSSITRHSRQSSFGPTTPTSFTRPWTGTAGNGSPNSGLGIGFPTDFVHGKTGTGYLLPEQMVQISDKSAGTIQFDESGEIIGISGHQLHNSPPAKGKRKPVPQALDNALPDDFDRLEVAEEVHAL